jgi:hypothetical protein
MRERELGIITLVEDSGEPEAQAAPAVSDSAADEEAKEAAK